MREMAKKKVGGLDVSFAGGTDRDGGGDGPAIVLCHGFGAPGEDLVSLWRAIDAGRGVRWIFPEAPLSLGPAYMGGRAWWLIDMAKLDEAIRTGRRDELAESVPVGMDKAREALESCLAELEEKHGLVRERTILGGFSQGAMISTEIALHAKKPFAGLAILSGTLLCRDRWKAAATESAPSIHAVQSHGRRDPLLPFSLAEELRDILRGAGGTVDFVTHNGAHEIPQSALDGLAKLARERLSST